MVCRWVVLRLVTSRLVSAPYILALVMASGAVFALMRSYSCTLRVCTVDLIACVDDINAPLLREAGLYPFTRDPGNVPRLVDDAVYYTGKDQELAAMVGLAGLDPDGETCPC